MSQLKRTFKMRRTLYKKKYRRSISRVKKQFIWLNRTLFVTKERLNTTNAGFVLPTVVMVSLVVVLLTTAILFRSFERSKNASNVRVNEAVLNAAAPAVDRARAKLDALLEDPTLPRGTPSDNALYDALKKDKYRLGDETRLKLVNEFNSTSNIQQNTTLLEDDETLKSAWKYAVDTDNNGKKDTFTLYSIYFRSPSRDSTTGQFNRERNPLEARTPPMDNDSTNTQCRNAAGFSTLVGNSSWYKLQSGNLGKSFFVYTVNVPITKSKFDSLPDTINGEDKDDAYEPYNGNQGFVALEFQQDRSRIPLPNNAVWFENDLEIIVGSTKLLLNGRIHTNGNLLVGETSSGEIKLRQVSSKYSCFYNQENGQISVGGNVGTGNISHTSNQGSVVVDLYNGFENDPNEGQSISSTNKSTNSSGGSQIGFNDAAYNQRIAAMKTTAIGLCSTCQSATSTSTFKTNVANSGYPEDVKKNVAAKVDSADDIATAKKVLADEIEIYLRNRTRRVPFAEVSDPTGAGATTSYTAIAADLKPQQDWREPVNSSNQFYGATSVTLTTSQLQATYPILQKQQGIQSDLGDRILVGNNLPALWLKNSQYVGSDANQLITSSSGTAVNWTNPTTQQRWRNTQIQALADLGISDRNGFWEEKAAENPANDLDSVGGLRIVTGAGIYVDGPGDAVNSTTGPFYPRGLNSFLPIPNSSDNTVVWLDTMAMSSPDPSKASLKGDLLMRATAVYHYKDNSGTAQTPIACVSSYYDPTDATTNKNKTAINGSTNLPWNAAAGGKSNNGIVYAYPGRDSFTTYKTRLELQANLKFPNGRWVNQPLKDALAKIGSGTTVPTTGLQLADYSAIDTALCAISILNDETTFATTLTNKPEHGAIKEASFLDGREAKQISAASTSTNYDLDLEQRQPLEIRVTDIDLGSLASKAFTSGSGASTTTTEYLLPYSGIIYATRDDGLRDASDTTAESELLSPTDFKLDQTRRPNGIRLWNGESLARGLSSNNNAFNAREKGLILVSNLPAYIKGKFNLHQTSIGASAEIEEFTELVADASTGTNTVSTSNFYSRGSGSATSQADTRFACRINRTGCSSTNGNGDYWRPATIIADAMTLLSGTFTDGVRSEGDYDLNNNTGIAVESNFDPANLNTSTLDERRRKRLKNGFWENNFATSTDWAQTTSGSNPKSGLGSYALNGITPIQRRLNVSTLANNPGEYLMEVCTKLPVSECGSGDWYVDPSTNLKASTAVGQTFNISTHKAGTTAVLAASEYRRYARRVAFKRNSANELQEQGNNKYIPIGIDTSGIIQEFAYASGGLPRTRQNALWFRTSNDASVANLSQVSYTPNNRLYYYLPIDADGNGSPDLDGQPLLVPVLQIHDANNTSSIRGDTTTQSQFSDKWLQQVSADTTFNATFVLGNSPSRPDEESAGLQNLVRFIENWDSSTRYTAKISGSFIQFQRSAYATAPFTPIFKNRMSSVTTPNVSTLGNLSLFDYALDTYPTQNNNGISPFYQPPTRKWGFDVGILSEQPDLFAQRFTSPPTGRPNEFFREVGRDDIWVKTLLCAGEPGSSTYVNAVPNEYRPSGCPSIPND
ncbi:hormogonium polysaccharide biosynthesis protein HpsA [Pelatocladus sp. BLCC-F211]|uniref:hormogonium polysaccharide biosynthesis protein HpsA n=1 Tax=Pelatocladus sp. BLCC-F211 TaxID=3342752 RepID=UPI0035B6E56A